MKAQPSQITVEPLRIGRLIEVSVLHPPIGDRTRDAMDQLLDRILSLLGILWIAVKVLADDDIGGQLTPRRWDLAVGLLEKNLSILVLDRRAAGLPLNRLKRV